MLLNAVRPARAGKIGEGAPVVTTPRSLEHIFVQSALIMSYDNVDCNYFCS